MKIGKIISLFIAVQFKNPSRSNVVIIDRSGSDILNKMVLNDIHSVTLPSRFEVFYITPQIIGKLFKNTLKFINKVKNIKISAFIFQMYLLSCIEYMKPKVVVTFIDNNRHYQALSKYYNGAEFYYVMNGTRNAWDLDILNRFSMTNLLCWGQQNIDQYNSYNHRIDHYHPVGPLISSYYKTEIAPKSLPVKYNICIVSQYKTNFMEGSVSPTFRLALNRMNEFLKRYLKHRNLLVCIATASQDKSDLSKEIAYYREIYGQAIDIIEQDRANYSTYRAIDESNVIVSVHCTAAFEAYSWGKKVLMCNMSGDRLIDVDIMDELMIRNYDYFEFQTKLDNLLKMSYEEYMERTRANREYIVKFDRDRPTHRYLRNIIQNRLEEQKN